MTKNAFIAITGRANAGKSSLTNLLVGEKISIVSEKPQTTRNRINGVLTKGDTQYVFMDTPGMHKPKTKLSEHMVKSIRQSVDDVDCAILMADVTKKISSIEQDLIRSFASHGTAVVLLLNKVDLLKDKSEILKIIQQYSELYDFEEIIPISVKNRINTDQIMPVLERFAVEGEHFFPDDIATDRTERFMCSEIVREKILRVMQEEIPHGVAVDVEKFKSRMKGDAEIIDISVVIICEKESHKGMIIGKGGERLKQIGTMARGDMEDLLQAKVNLQCFVKVKEDWRNRERVISDLGMYDED
ncbi:MAG: GTPase Era [Eubacterium sp.]|jgi:GTP-binding protein Era|nr:GTPase Era [Eubacterium sp.]CCY72447.1 gTPase Era [Eubacterium sp. CAG:115]